MTPQAQETNAICSRLKDKIEARYRAKEAAIMAAILAGDDPDGSNTTRLVAAEREHHEAMGSVQAIHYNLSLAEATYSDEDRLRAISNAEKFEKEIV
jgi:hypothetical protein